MKKSTINIRTGEVEEFFGRIRKDAARLDRGEFIAPEVSITFEDATELLSVLSTERVRLLRCAKRGSVALTELALGVDRDVRAVSRDVDRLEKAGLLRTSFRVNPGHGRYKVVEPVAREYKLVASI